MWDRARRTYATVGLSAGLVHTGSYHAYYVCGWAEVCVVCQCCVWRIALSVNAVIMCVLVDICIVCQCCVVCLWVRHALSVNAVLYVCGWGMHCLSMLCCMSVGEACIVCQCCVVCLWMRHALSVNAVLYVCG